MNATFSNLSAQRAMRNPIAWLFTLFIPRFGFGGGMGGLLATIGVLSAIPAYQDHSKRAHQAWEPRNGSRYGLRSAGRITEMNGYELFTIA